MESKLLLVLAMCAYITVSEGIKCYKCSRWEFGIINGGDNEDECEYATDKTPHSDDCTFCVTEYVDKFGFDWVERKCFKEATCTDGEVPGSYTEYDELNAITYDVNRECCNTENCNNKDFNFDSGVSIQFAGSLVGAILFSIYFNFRQ